MTPYSLQKALAEKLEELLKDMNFKNDKKEMTHIKIFLQNLPKLQQKVKHGSVMPEEEKKVFPFCTVRMDSGNLKPGSGFQKAYIILVFGIYDNDPLCQGYQAVLNSFEKITEHFTKNPVLNGLYKLDEGDEIIWMLDNEDRHPYYFGSMEMTWNTLAVRREDPYA